MRGVNKVILVGSLGADPQHKSFPNGGSYAQFSIATSERWQDKQTGERPLKKSYIPEINWSLNWDD